MQNLRMIEHEITIIITPARKKKQIYEIILCRGMTLLRSRQTVRKDEVNSQLIIKYSHKCLR